MLKLPRHPLIHVMPVRALQWNTGLVGPICRTYPLSLAQQTLHGVPSPL